MNRFFDIALSKATRITGKPGRILLVLTQLGGKVKSTAWSALAKESKEKLMILARMAHAFGTGRYRGISVKSITIIVAGILYFINPLDLIPDFVFVIGLTDDASVLLWICSRLQKEIDQFIIWEQGMISR